MNLLSDNANDVFFYDVFYLNLYLSLAPYDIQIYIYDHVQT